MELIHNFYYETNEIDRKDTQIEFPETSTQIEELVEWEQGKNRVELCNTYCLRGLTRN